MTNSISNKLFLVLLLCSSVILGIGMALDYRLSSSAILEQMRLEADETIDTAISNLDNLLDGVEGATVFFGNVLQQREYSLEELQQMLAVAVQPTGKEHHQGQHQTLLQKPHVPSIQNGRANIKKYNSEPRHSYRSKFFFFMSCVILLAVSSLLGL